MKYIYKAWIVEVVDGGTFDALVYLPFDVSIKQRFKLYDFEAPDLFAPSTKAEAAHAQESKDEIDAVLVGAEFLIETFKSGTHGHYYAKVTLDDGLDFATQMKAGGMEKKESYD